MSRAQRIRIVAGALRGRWVGVPDGIRPTSARVREAIASIWSDRIRDARVLELCAGSGAVGLEAWSRGADKVTFVESNRSVLETLRSNLRIAEMAALRILPQTAKAALARLEAEGAQFDLVFADPPYEERVDDSLLAAIATVTLQGALLAIEHRAGSAPSEASPHWRCDDCRRYGDSVLSLFTRLPSADQPLGSEATIQSSRGPGKSPRATVAAAASAAARTPAASGRTPSGGTTSGRM